MCQRGLRAHIANVRNAYQRANKRANEPKVCQLFNLAYQRAKGMPSFQLGVQTAWQFFIVPKGMSNFQTFVLRNAKGISILYYYIKNSTL